MDRHEVLDPHIGGRVASGPAGSPPPGCDFSPRHGDRRCAAPPARHLRTRAPGKPDVGLLACADPYHLGVARNAGMLIDEHDYRPACSHPHARWGQGRCAPPADTSETR